MDRVEEFLQEKRGELELDVNDIDVIYDQRVSGKAFLRLNKEQLTRNPGPLKLLYGLASAIAELVVPHFYIFVNKTEYLLNLVLFFPASYRQTAQKTHHVIIEQLKIQREIKSFNSLLELRQHISVDKPPVFQGYCVIIISGGSGVGKTHIIQIVNFIVNDEWIRTQMYPQIPKDIDKTEEVLIMSILFCQSIDFNKDETGPRCPLALILQIDEFQISTYWAITLQSFTISASQFKTTNLHLLPMNFSESEIIFDCFIIHYNNCNYILPNKSNIYNSIVNAIREIPVIIESNFRSKIKRV
ncbi:hypothetical protein C1645_829011 [Glomus cerebriforme]|uniref:Uncharacterized protein n=1 Tax=Glomus cerebriforme TaxID=658196 RepID=A0A397SKF3_9GLOM|nr:hypothetical protein C1645_829011 [Glomus cerebriforme]